MLGQESARSLPRQAPLRSPEGRARSTLLALSLLFAGCTGVAEMTGTATQQDLMQLRSELDVVQRSVQRAQATADAASGQTAVRSRDQGRETEQQVAVLSRRLDALTTSVTALATRVDDLAARLEAQARQATRSAPPAAVAPRTPPAPVPLPATPAPAAPPPAAGSPSASVPRTGAASLGAQDVYQAAYIDYSKGSYALAVAGFREFIRRYPEHELADNAQYWIGESLYSLGRTYANQGQSERYVQSLEQAVQEFKKVVANYPRGDKAPTALYKEALALIELKQPAVAQARLQYLIDNFPQAEETPLARERLASLKDR